MSETAHQRTPELGPLLGPLFAPARPAPAWLDQIRLSLLDELFLAAGEARRAPEPDQGLPPALWLEVFRRAADRAAAHLCQEIDRRVDEAATASRMPRRLVVARKPGDDERRALRNRLQSAAIPLEQVVEQEGGARDGGPASAPETATVARVVTALLAAWDRLAAFAADELGRGLQLASEVEQWRRPRGLLIGITAAVFCVALTLGLMLGGYLPAPGPLAQLRELWWRLPWP